MTMQDCNGLTNAFVETDMADMEGLRKQLLQYTVQWQ